MITRRIPDKRNVTTIEGQLVRALRPISSQRAEAQVSLEPVTDWGSRASHSITEHCHPMQLLMLVSR